MRSTVWSLFRGGHNETVNQLTAICWHTTAHGRIQGWGLGWGIWGVCNLVILSSLISLISLISIGLFSVIDEICMIDVRHNVLDNTVKIICMLRTMKEQDSCSGNKVNYSISIQWRVIMSQHQTTYHSMLALEHSQYKHHKDEIHPQKPWCDCSHTRQLVQKKWWGCSLSLE